MTPQEALKVIKEEVTSRYHRGKLNLLKALGILEAVVDGWVQHVEDPPSDPQPGQVKRWNDAKGMLEWVDPLPWIERLGVVTVNPLACRRDDIARMASELLGFYENYQKADLNCCDLCGESELNSKLVWVCENCMEAQDDLAELNEVRKRLDQETPTECQTAQSASEKKTANEVKASVGMVALDRSPVADLLERIEKLENLTGNLVVVGGLEGRNQYEIADRIEKLESCLKPYASVDISPYLLDARLKTVEKMLGPSRQTNMWSIVNGLKILVDGYSNRIARNRRGTDALVKRLEKLESAMATLGKMFVLEGFSEGRD